MSAGGVMLFAGRVRVRLMVAGVPSLERQHVLPALGSSGRGLSADADLLGQAVTCLGPHDPAPDPAEVTVDTRSARLPGSLVIPPDAGGLVVFVQGSGSSRHSPRNQFVAAGLNRAGLGTLLVDLLTPDEELSRTNVFNVALLAARLTAITRWLRDQPGTGAVPVGYFGASTGTAAALPVATATPRLPITAIVSRSGRPDLVGGRLALVQAPTLLIVGGADTVILNLNQYARTQLKCESRLAVVPGATHLFPEPAALGQVTGLAADWFGRHFAGPTSSRPRPEGATFGPARADQRPCRSGRLRTMLGA